jgi:hypothetical protein
MSVGCIAQSLEESVMRMEKFSLSIMNSALGIVS